MFRNFDIEKDKISDFKFIFVFPDGKSLLMPFSKNDDKTRNDYKYAHRVYLAKAIDLIVEHFNYDKERYIADLGGFSTYSILHLMLKNNISVFRNVLNRDRDGDFLEHNYGFFSKPPELTIKQKDYIWNLKKPLEEEDCLIGVELLHSDQNIRLVDNCGLICGIRKEFDHGIDLVLYGQNGFNVEQFFYIMGIDNEKNMQIER